MKFEEIAKRAYKEEGYPEFCDLPCKYAYLQLEQLYNKYKLGTITKEDSIIEKKRIEKDYNFNEEDYQENLEIYRIYNRKRADNEVMLSKIEKSKDIKEILEYSFKIIANCLNDGTFVERNLEKLSKIDF